MSVENEGRDGIQDTGTLLKVEQVGVVRVHEEWGRIWHVAWSPDGSLLASCGSDRAVKLWGKEGDKWVLRDTLEGEHTRTIRRVSFSPDGRCLAAASFDGTTSISELQDGEYRGVAQVEGHENEVKAAEFDGSGSLLATCSRDKSVWIWGVTNPDDFDCAAVLHGHSGDVKTVAWRPGGKELFSCSYDNTIRRWVEAEDGDDWEPAQTLNGHAGTVWDMSFSPDGTLLTSGGSDRALVLWSCRAAHGGDPNTGGGAKGKWVKACQVADAHDRYVYSVHWSPGLDLIATAGADDALCFYSVCDRASPTPSLSLRARVPRAHETDINCVRWHPKQPDLLATCGDDGMIRFWRVSATS